MTQKHLDFGPGTLRRRLSELPIIARAAFTTACAQRQFSLYLRFHQRSGKGQPAVLVQALARLWADFLGEASFPEAERQESIVTLEAMIPAEYDYDDEGGMATDAINSTVCALTCSLTGDLQSAIWSAEFAFETLYSHVSTYIINLDEIDDPSFDKDKAATEHPLVQTELARQQRDLDEITAACQQPGGLLALIPTLRARAIAEAITFE